MKILAIILIASTIVGAIFFAGYKLARALADRKSEREKRQRAEKENRAHEEAQKIDKKIRKEEDLIRDGRRSINELNGLYNDWPKEGGPTT